MPVEPVVTPVEPVIPPVKVEFTPEQQEHINNLFNQRFAKVTAKHESEMKAMSDAIEALKTKPVVVTPPVKEGNTSEDNVRQMREFLAQEKENSKNLKGLLDASKVEKDKIIEENKKILKDQAIAEAASTLPNGVEFHE